MIEIRISGKTIPLSPGTKITVKETSPLWSGKLGRGSQSYKFSLPNLPETREILDFADVLTQVGNQTIYKNVGIYYGGMLFRRGTLTVEQTSKKSFSASIAIENSALSQALNAKTLDEYTYGGGRVISASSDPLVIAQDLQNLALAAAAGTQASHDFTFFPIRNDSLNVSSYPFPYVNWYDPGSSSFPLIDYIPYPYLYYVLRHIIEAEGFSWSDGAFWAQSEILSLVIYNNHFLHYALEPTNPDYKSFFIAQHVPRINALEFVRGIKDLFGLVPITQGNKLEWYTRNQILADSSQIDWREKCMDYGTLYEVYDGLAYFSEQDGSDARIDLAKDPRPDLVVIGTLATKDLLPAGILNDVYYIEAENAFYHHDGTAWNFYGYDLAEVEVDGGEEEEFSSVSTLMMYQGEIDPAFSGQDWRTPHTDIALSGLYNENVEYQDYSPRLLFYRGIQNKYGSTYPYASADDDAGNYTHSLFWHGQNGLYEKHWKEWTEAIATSKVAPYTLKLTETDLHEFSWIKKVRVRTYEGEAVGLVREMSYTLSDVGISAVSAEIVRL
ncbi:MAG: hypothetical protein AAFP92_31380 [Bacteroidota bacterium]